MLWQGSAALGALSAARGSLLVCLACLRACHVLLVAMRMVMAWSAVSFVGLGKCLGGVPQAGCDLAHSNVLAGLLLRLPGQPYVTRALWVTTHLAEA